MCARTAYGSGFNSRFFCLVGYFCCFSNFSPLEIFLLSGDLSNATKVIFYAKFMFHANLIVRGTIIHEVHHAADIEVHKKVYLNTTNISK